MKWISRTLALAAMALSMLLVADSIRGLAQQNAELPDVIAQVDR